MPKKQKTPIISLPVTTISALLIAMSIVLGKYLAIPVGDSLRFSFENLPILLSGIVFGPVIGVMVAIAADLIGCILVGYAINPIVTLGATFIGLCSGLIFRLTAKAPLGMKIPITVAISHLIGSVIIKSFGLASFYAIPFWQLLLWRTVNYLIIGLLECFLLFAIMKNNTIRTQLEKFHRR